MRSASRPCLPKKALSGYRSRADDARRPGRRERPGGKVSGTPPARVNAPGGVLELAMELLRRPSITPRDAGCQELLAQRLARHGFQHRDLSHGEVCNSWLWRGTGRPLFAFLGHTDVVPPGPEEDWSTPPFAPTLRNDCLYGRGAADMKGSIAAMTVAAEAFLARHPEHPGSLGLLLTSDEEGPALNGTKYAAGCLAEAGLVPDYCLVGEPSSEQVLGDTIKVGRRGSLQGRLQVLGRQGHIAYPERADNALHRVLPALAALCAERWDEGDERFPPTSFQVSNLHAGVGAENVVPGRAEIRFNFRYAPSSDTAGLQRRVNEILARHKLRYELDWQHSAEPFHTRGGRLLEAARAAVREVTGRDCALSTSGGTSDGRFLAPLGAEVLECGPLNASIHQVDEHLALKDLELLARLYQRVLENLLLGSSAPGREAAGVAAMVSDG